MPKNKLNKFLFIFTCMGDFYDHFWTTVHVWYVRTVHYRTSEASFELTIVNRFRESKFLHEIKKKKLGYVLLYFFPLVE